MRVTYTPEGEPAQVWEFNPKRVRQSEAEMIEKRAGSWDAWVDACKAEEPSALRVLLWVLIRRQHPALRMEDVPDFYMGEVTTTLDLDELNEARDLLIKHGDRDPVRAKALLVAIDQEIADLRAAGEVETGKAASPNSMSVIAGISPPTSD